MERRSGMAPTVQSSADIDPNVEIGARTQVWHLAQVRAGARIGEGCVIGRGAYVGSEVRVGDSCKIQNHALIYEPAVLSRGVFVGPGAVLTNDRRPRAVNPDMTAKSATDWEPVGVRVHEGASIGAQAVCVAPLTIGRWAMVAAGAVVTHDVGDFELVAGNPARRIGWVGRAGASLIAAMDGFVCPLTGARYEIQNGSLVESVEDGR